MKKDVALQVPVPNLSKVDRKDVLKPFSSYPDTKVQVNSVDRRGVKDIATCKFYCT